MASLGVKQRKGEFLGAYAAYGYLRSPADRTKLVVNTETAEIVKKIFIWRLEGCGYGTICKKLIEMGVPSPGRYLFLNGLVKNEKFSRYTWTPATVKNILSNPVYAGYMSSGKTKSRLQHGLPYAAVRPDDWVNVPGMHEAIIDEEMFWRVSEIRG